MTLKVLQVSLTNPQRQTGWYQDVYTGQQYYHDALTDTWYFSSAGLLYPLTTYWEYGRTPINAAIGDVIAIEASFKYQGSAKTVKLYGAIGFGTTNTGLGNDTGQFQEGSPAGTAQFTVGPDDTPKTYTKTVDVVVPTNVWMPAGYYVGLAGRKASLYCKIIDGVSLVLFKTLSAYLAGVLEVTGVEAAFSDLSVVDYYKKE